MTLIDAGGADPNGVDTIGQPPLLCAIRNGPPEVDPTMLKSIRLF